MRGDTLIRYRAHQEVFRSAPPRRSRPVWGGHPQFPFLRRQS